MKTNSIAIVLAAAAALPLCAALPPHVGYVYPAGANPGQTLTVTIGGQFIEAVSGVHLSGAGVMPAEKRSYVYEVDNKAGNNLKNQKAKLEAILAEEQDPLKKEQLQYHLDQLAEKEQMMMMTRKQVRKDPVQARRKQFNPQLAEQLQIEITIPPHAKPGLHELRLVTTNGISNYLMFQIGTLREAAETEPNDTPPKACAAGALPAVLNGQVMPGDTDCFRFTASQGQTLVFRARARALVPYLADAVPGWFQAVLTLYDASGREVACCDDFYFDPDPVLIYEVPADGDYILSINDSIFRGREDFVYRIEAGELPFIQHMFPLGGRERTTVPVQLSGVNLSRAKTEIKTGSAPDLESVYLERFGLRSNTRLFAVDSLPEATEAEPNDLTAAAQKLSLPVVVNGRMDRPGDLDCFRFEGKAGQALSIEVTARRLGSPLDARLVLLDPEEHVIAFSDDVEDKSEGLITHHADPCITTNLPADGIYTVRLDNLQGAGGPEYAYRLRLGREQPDFHLRLTPASLRIPSDGSAVVIVHAIRKGGFNGPVQITMTGGADGFELGRALIPAGASQASVTIHAAGRRPGDILELELEGTAEIGARTVTRRAVPAEDMMQAFIYRHLVPAGDLLVMISEPDPVAVTVNLPGSGVVEARPGTRLNLDTVLERHASFKGPVQLELSDPPEWIKLSTKGINRAGKNTVSFDISSNAEVGETATLLLIAKVRLAKPATDPTFNPIMKSMNFQTVTMTVAAIPLIITD